MRIRWLGTRFDALHMMKSEMLSQGPCLFTRHFQHLITIQSNTYTGLGNETGTFQNIKKNRHMDFLYVYWS